MMLVLQKAMPHVAGRNVPVCQGGWHFVQQDKLLLVVCAP